MPEYQNARIPECQNTRMPEYQNARIPELTPSAMFFSGGLDAFTTLIEHIDEKPILITLWGADVDLNDEIGWGNVLEHIDYVSKLYDLNYISIKSCFRKFLNEGLLSEAVKISKDGWWHGFQHGLGLLVHAAPLAYMLGLPKIYIASTYCYKNKGKYTCASDSTIDNHVKYCKCSIDHDGYKYTRQDKAHVLTQYRKNNNIKLPIRVCWESKGGENCCKCEKCYRTIMNIIVEGADPNDYGFVWNNKAIKNFKWDMLTKISVNYIIMDMEWKDIIDRLKVNKDIISDYNSYQWLLDIDYNKFNNMPLKRMRKILSFFKRALKKILKTLKC